jgi:hypothetical protein
MKKLQVSIVAQLYNEEYLLPFWIEWHRNLNVKKVILIDYGSTDRSVEIIKEMAPDAWEVVPSVNSDFDAEKVDKEVMETERRLSGWKMALNITEFLIPGPGLYRALGPIRSMLRRRRLQGAFAFRQLIVTGRCEEHYFPMNLSELVSGFRYGMLPGDEFSMDDVISRNTPRFMHCCKDGAYMCGRHRTELDIYSETDLAYIAWLGFYPWNPSLIERKMQIKNKIPQIDIDRKYGWQHMLNCDDLERKRAEFLDFSEDLLIASSGFRKAFEFTMKQQEKYKATNSR